MKRVRFLRKTVLRMFITLTPGVSIGKKSLSLFRSDFIKKIREEYTLKQKNKML